MKSVYINRVKHTGRERERDAKMDRSGRDRLVRICLQADRAAANAAKEVGTEGWRNFGKRTSVAGCCRVAPKCFPTRRRRFTQTCLSDLAATAMTGLLKFGFRG
jgi:hypothetical protein